MKKILIILAILIVNFTLVNAFTGFSLSPIFSITDETLPVTLSAFYAMANSDNQSITINWTSESEMNLIGYHLHRGQEPSLSQAIIITPSIIPGQNSALANDYMYQDFELETEINYYYWLQSVDYSGSNFFGPISVKIENDQDVSPLPESTELVSIYPNPFHANISANIEVKVKENETSTLTIYNLKGQVVQKRTINSGNHRLDWNGYDDAGRKCSNGVYFIKMKSPTYSKISKILLLK
jgi:hypothetical protein